jgi:hypothetical protein
MALLGLKPEDYEVLDGMTEVIPCYVWIVDILVDVQILLSANSRANPR